MNKQNADERKIFPKLENLLHSFEKKVSIHMYDFLVKQHSYLLEFIKNPIDNRHLNEFSLVNSVLEGTVKERVKKINQILETKDKNFKVKPNGEIVGTGKYEVLDPKWAEALVEFLENYKKCPEFRDNPPTIKINDNVVIAVFGDFGTGNWKNSNVGSVISSCIKNCHSNYSIHLGDTYYSGSFEECTDNLLSLWPEASEGNFTLNGNHEMYNVDAGYFNVLANKLFTLQKQNSYFALENNNWCIVGLDSAFFADKKSMYMEGAINDSQIKFLQEIAKKKKNVVVFSHHNPIDDAGDVKMPIFDQVSNALGNTLKYWYFGHTHCAAVYKDIEGIKFRLSGHAAVPYGDALNFANSDKVIWYENTPPVNTIGNSLRVQNGFNTIELNGSNITEKFYGEDSKEHYTTNNITDS